MADTYCSALRSSDGASQIAVVIEPASRVELEPMIVSGFRLTRREADTMTLLLRGLQTKSIASTLHISAHTANDHVKAVYRPAAGDPQDPDRLDPPVTSLRGAGGGAGQRGTGRRVGVQRIGLALGPASLAIWSVDLDDARAHPAQMPRKGGTVGAGALHPHPLELTVAAQPGQQSPVAGRGCGELPVAELTANLVDHRGVVGLAMSVNAADDGDRGRRAGHAGHAVPLPLGSDRSGALGWSALGNLVGGVVLVTAIRLLRTHHRPRVFVGMETQAGATPVRHGNQWDLAKSTEAQCGRTTPELAWTKEQAFLRSGRLASRWGLLFAQTKGRVIVWKVVADWRDVNAPAAHRFARGSHVTPTDKRTATRSWQATIFRLSG